MSHIQIERSKRLKVSINESERTLNFPFLPLRTSKSAHKIIDYQAMAVNFDQNDRLT